MKNLKQYSLERLDNLPHNAGIHEQYDSAFGSMKSMWDGRRDWHGDEWLATARKIIKGSVGKTLSRVVERIKYVIPKSYYKTPFDFVYSYIDYIQNEDGSLHLKERRWRAKQITTVEELATEVNRWMKYAIYLDKNNCIQVVHNAKRYRGPKRSKKTYYEDRASKRKAMKIQRTNEELLQTMTNSFLGNRDLYQAFTTLRKAWRQAQRDVSEHYNKSIDPDHQDYWRSWNRYMWREAKKELKTLTADMNAVNVGDLSVLNVYIQAIQEKREKEQERLSNAA